MSSRDLEQNVELKFFDVMQRYLSYRGRLKRKLTGMRKLFFRIHLKHEIFDQNYLLFSVKTML